MDYVIGDMFTRQPVILTIDFDNNWDYFILSCLRRVVYIR